MYIYVCIYIYTNKYSVFFMMPLATLSFMPFSNLQAFFLSF